MGTSKKELAKIETIVEDILEVDELARGDDKYLFTEVCKAYNPRILDVPFGSAMKNFNAFGVPAIESVGRLRRKVQSEKPWLMAADKVTKWRSDNEAVFEKYVREMETRGQING